MLKPIDRRVEPLKLFDVIGNPRELALGRRRAVVIRVGSLFVHTRGTMVEWPVTRYANLLEAAVRNGAERSSRQSARLGRERKARPGNALNGAASARPGSARPRPAPQARV